MAQPNPFNIPGGMSSNSGGVPQHDVIHKMRLIVSTLLETLTASELTNSPTARRCAAPVCDTISVQHMDLHATKQ